MSLFATMNLREMKTNTVQCLMETCDLMLKEAVAEAHWQDYQELKIRLAAEYHDREQAAIKIQSLFRGNKARAETRAEIQRRELEKQNQAALTIQSAFRMHKARNTLEGLRRQQELKVNQQLQQADTLLEEQIDDPSMVDRDAKLEIARLLEVYEAAELNAKGKKATHPSKRASRAAKTELDEYVAQIVHLVEAQLAAQKKILDAARTVTLPADFRQNGALVDYGNFLYPGAGELVIGGKSYQLHPNRSLVHVRQEVADNATLATAQAYFDAVLKTCRSVINSQRGAEPEVLSDWIRINDTTDTGAAVRWNVRYTRYDSKKHPRGLAGSVEHIDSGYESSPWLPQAKRGKCRTCNKGKNRHDFPNPAGHPIS
jgi:hypothetical protein